MAPEMFSVSKKLPSVNSVRAICINLPRPPAENDKVLINLSNPRTQLTAALVAIDFIIRADRAAAIFEAPPAPSRVQLSRADIQTQLNERAKI